mmetsp:Transcript_94229/g.162960  ORF Transcript_94229/g.162960 Transcript_94229/m.162960 type:complete len:88 (-) Transcript_94229:503-766(-)
MTTGRINQILGLQSKGFPGETHLPARHNTATGVTASRLPQSIAGDDSGWTVVWLRKRNQQRRSVFVHRNTHSSAPNPQVEATQRSTG